MAATRVGTHSERKITANSTEADITHTVPSGATLLLVFIGTEGGEAISGTPQWSLGGGENLTLIQTIGTSSNANDCRGYWYALVSPTDGAGTVSIDFDSVVNPAYALADNWDGTVVTSEAAAVLDLSTDLTETPTASNANSHSSAGNAGNSLVCGSIFQGNDGHQATYDANFSLLDDGATGGSSSSDFAHTHFFEEDIPSARSVTIGWQSSDQNASGYIEIVAASAGTTLIADPGSLTLTGSEATFTTVLVAVAASLVLTGADADLDIAMDAQPGALTLTGGEADFTVPGTLDAQPGALTLTGADASFIIPSVARSRGGARILFDLETESDSISELIELIEPEIQPETGPEASREGLESIMGVRRRVTIPAKKRGRVDKLLADTGLTIEELLIIIG